MQIPPQHESPSCLTAETVVKPPKTISILVFLCFYFSFMLFPVFLPSLLLLPCSVNPSVPYVSISGDCVGLKVLHSISLAQLIPLQSMLPISCYFFLSLPFAFLLFHCLPLSIFLFLLPLQCNVHLHLFSHFSTYSIFAIIAGFLPYFALDLSVQ